jgi:polar amino acid transport system substrate-binding protein
MIPGLLVGAILALGSGPAWGQGSPPIRPLRIALENYPPYEYAENGDAKGINVDIIKHILYRLGIPYEFKVYPFSRGWLMLKRGTADAAPSISYSKEREPFLFYTDAQRAFDKTGAIPDDYLWMTKYVFFANRKFAKSLNFESYDQIQKDGYKIGIVKEYTYHPGFLEEDFIFKPYFTVEDGLQGLARGEVDLFPWMRPWHRISWSGSGYGIR